MRAHESLNRLTQPMALLRVEHLLLQYDYFPVCAPVSFSVDSGQALWLTGPNGQGKSTVLRSVAGYTTPISGHIYFEGRAIKSSNAYMHHRHYIPPTPALRSAYTVKMHFDWVAHLHQRRRPQTFQATLAAYGLTELLDVNVMTLSSGQRRKVHLASLDLWHAPLWILDEPVNALDAQACETFIEKANAYLASGGAIVYTAHQPLGALAQQSKTLSLTPYVCQPA